MVAYVLLCSPIENPSRAEKACPLFSSAIISADRSVSCPLYEAPENIGKTESLHPPVDSDNPDEYFLSRHCV